MCGVALKEGMNENIAEGDAEIAMLKNKAMRYEELRTAITLTADEQAELKGLAVDLQNVLGDSATVVNALTGEYNDLTDAVDAYIRKQSASLKLAAAEDAAKEAYKTISDIDNEIAKAEATIEEEKEKIEKYKSLSSWDKAKLDLPEQADLELAIKTGYTINMRKAQEAIESLNASKAEAQQIIDDWEKLGAENFVEINKGVSFSLNPNIDNSSLNDDVKAHYAAIAEKNLEIYKSNLADMDYYLKMGYITSDEYYAKLENMRDKYLETDTDEWRSVNVELKKYYDSLTEDHKKAYEQQLKQQKEAAEQAQRERLASYNEEKSQLQFRHKTGQISEKQYYEELAKIRDKYLDKNSAEWRNSFLETYQYNQKIIEANKDALNALLSETSDSTLSALQNIISARDSLTSKLVDFNKTFEKITETVPETIAVKGEFTVTTAEHEVETYKMGADSIEDNIKILEEYGEMLDALKARGADDGTLNDILAMDVDEAIEFGSKMPRMSDRE